MEKILSSNWVRFSALFCFTGIQTQLHCRNTQQSAAITSLPRSIYFFWTLSFSEKTCAIWEMLVYDFVTPEPSPPCISLVPCYFTIVAVSSLYISLLDSFLVISNRKQTLSMQTALMSELSLPTPFRYWTFFSEDICKPIAKLLISQRNMISSGMSCSESLQ